MAQNTALVEMYGRSCRFRSVYYDGKIFFERYSFDCTVNFVYAKSTASHSCSELSCNL